MGAAVELPELLLLESVSGTAGSNAATAAAGDANSVREGGSILTTSTSFTLRNDEAAGGASTRPSSTLFTIEDGGATLISDVSSCSSANGDSGVRESTRVIPPCVLSIANV